jgi:L-asparaginase II
MSLLFARLATLPELSLVFEAMHRYPAVVSGNGEGDTAIATATNSVAKGGALGCIGIGVKSGLGVAIKSWDGLNTMVDVAAVATLDALGLLSDAALESLDGVARPPQMGGGESRGVAELQFT